ncbi:MAG: hypothetical protein FP831_09200 [Anaerolineae bacterium]|nr:hypothetical protein [Anaerolineae bacterium]
MNKITRNTLSIALALIFVSALAIPVLAQDGTTGGADFGNFIDPDTGLMLPGVIDAGEITIDNPEWASGEDNLGTAYQEASYHQYIAPNGDTILAPSLTTMNAMIMNGETSGLLASEGSYQNPVGLIASWMALGQGVSDLTYYTNQPGVDANGNLTMGGGYNVDDDISLDAVREYILTNLQKVLLGTYSGGSSGLTASGWAALVQAGTQLIVGGQDHMLAGTYLYYTVGNCANSPVGCQAVCQANPIACAAVANSLIPTPVPYTAPSCPASTIVPGSPSLSISKTGPSNPLVVGQDPDRRGADVSFYVVVPPTVYTYYIPIPIYEDVKLCVGNDDGTSVVGGNCTAGSVKGTLINTRQLLRVDCEKHVEVYAEPIGAVNATADLNSDSINWINHELSSYYYGAHTIQTSFGLVPGLGSANVYCDGGKTCHANGAVTNIPFADPGTFSLNLFAATNGTPVSTGRTFRASGDLQVSFIAVRLIENGSH